jgi:hypothetical protein
MNKVLLFLLIACLLIFTGYFIRKIKQPYKLYIQIFAGLMLIALVLFSDEKGWNMYSFLLVLTAIIGISKVVYDFTKRKSALKS